MVLIVAKCIVNCGQILLLLFHFQVLIVAKCIVNYGGKEENKKAAEGINSSKVYCKSNVRRNEHTGLFGINSSKVYCK